MEPAKLEARWYLGAAAGLAAALALAWLYRVDPVTSQLYPRCFFHSLTGLHCPGCGSTRALHQLLHGRLFTALGLNPLMVLSLPFLAWWSFSRVTHRPQSPLPAVWIWLIFWGVLAFWILRNVPYYPFTWLAP